MKELKELEKYITIKETESNVLSLLFVDFKYDEKVENFNERPFDRLNSDSLNSDRPDVFTKNLEFSKTDKSLAKSLLVEKIIELSIKNKNDILDKFSMVNVDKSKIGSKIKNGSYYIAADGRLGPATNMLISEKNYEKYNIGNIKHNMEVMFDDLVDDLFIYKKNEMDNPGLVLCYNKDKYELLDIGFYPEKQFLKITL